MAKDEQWNNGFVDCVDSQLDYTVRWHVLKQCQTYWVKLAALSQLLAIYSICPNLILAKHGVPEAGRYQL